MYTGSNFTREVCAVRRTEASDLPAGDGPLFILFGRGIG